MLAQCFLLPPVLRACEAKCRLRKEQWFVLMYLFLMWGHGHLRSENSVLWCIYSLERGTIRPSMVNSFNWNYREEIILTNFIWKGSSTQILASVVTILLPVPASFSTTLLSSNSNQNAYAVNLGFHNILGIGRFLPRRRQQIISIGAETRTSDSGHLWLLIYCLWEFLF